MRITFLGTSHGVPEPNRNCSCALLEVADKRYLIDAGVDPTPLLINRGLTPCDISAIFITHAHGDHTNGLISFCDLCSWHFKEADPQIFLPDMSQLDALKAWISHTCGGLRESLRFSQVHEGKLFDDGVIGVEAIRTQHMPNAYAYRIKGGGKKVLFSGDMKGGDGPITDYARFAADDDIDLAIVEGVHFDPMLYLEPLRNHPPKQLCINHYSWRSLENCCRLKNALKDEIPVTLATDGLTIELR